MRTVVPSWIRVVRPASQDKVVVSANNQGRSYEEVLRKYEGASSTPGQLPQVIYVEDTALGQMVDERGPLDPGLHLDRPTLAIEADHPRERARVEEHASGAKLLPSHRVAPARDRDGASGLARADDRRADLLEGVHGHDLVDDRLVELGLDVGDRDHGPARRP